MRRSGIAPQAAHYNVLLAGLVRLQDLDRAHAVLQDMLQARVRPTLHTYNALLDAAVRSSNRARAYEMLDAMEEQFGAVRASAHMLRLGHGPHLTCWTFRGWFMATLQDQHAPDGCSYNIVARLYQDSDSAADAEALERLLARARARGVAQAELYHALMALYGRQGRVDATAATVARMAADGTDDPPTPHPARGPGQVRPSRPQPTHVPAFIPLPLFLSAVQGVRWSQSRSTYFWTRRRAPARARLRGASRICAAWRRCCRRRGSVHARVRRSCALLPPTSRPPPATPWRPRRTAFAACGAPTLPARPHRRRGPPACRRSPPPSSTSPATPCDATWHRPW